MNKKKAQVYHSMMEFKQEFLPASNMGKTADDKTSEEALGIKLAKASIKKARLILAKQ